MSSRKRKVEVRDADTLLARLVEQLPRGGRGGKEKRRVEPFLRAVAVSESLTHTLVALPTAYCRSYSRLSPRQKQVARLVAWGDHHKQIARKLSMAEGTIPTHVRRMWRTIDAEARCVLYLLGLVDEHQKKKRQKSKRQSSGAR
jgi:DNA-binding NarL/FixJ family response regulator